VRYKETQNQTTTEENVKRPQAPVVMEHVKGKRRGGVPTIATRWPWGEVTGGKKKGAAATRGGRMTNGSRPHRGNPKIEKD